MRLRQTFEFEHIHYLLIMDYSKFIEVNSLHDLSSSATIDAIKSQFSCHGIPEKKTDNGPQFSSREFSLFCEDYQIEHPTSSPHYPQSNGEAERGVQIVNRLWEKNPDKHLALLDYRTTPLASCGLSPAQLLMSRRPRNKLPTARELLKPRIQSPTEVNILLTKDKTKQQHYYNTKAVKDLPVLVPVDPVRMLPFPGSKLWLPTKVVDHHNSPRSYIVEYNGKKYRRNRKHLQHTEPENKILACQLPVMIYYQTNKNKCQTQTLLDHLNKLKCRPKIC